MAGSSWASLLPRQRQPSCRVWPPSTKAPLCHGTGQGTFRPGGQRPHMVPSAADSLAGSGMGQRWQGIGCRMGIRAEITLGWAGVGLVGDTHTQQVMFPHAHPSQPPCGGTGAQWAGRCGPPGTAVISGCLATESCTRQDGLGRVLHPTTHQFLPCLPLLMPCSNQPSFLNPGQCRISPRGGTWKVQSSHTPPRPHRCPIHPIPRDSQGRDRGISSSVGEAHGQQAQGRREELAEMLVLQSF